MEIQQPEHLVALDPRDPLSWENTPIFYAEWAKYILPQLNLNEQQIGKFLLGHLIQVILYEDGNCFGKGDIGRMLWEQELAHGMQRQIITRLDWEISSGILPEDISLKLNELLNNVHEYDWKYYENMAECRVLWRYIRMDLENKIYPGGEFEEAYNFFERTSSSIMDLWWDFIQGPF